MSTIEVPPLFFLLPAIVIGGYLGYRRGWLAELITSGGLVLASGLLWSGPGLLVGAFNWVLVLLARIAAAVIGGDPRRPPPAVSVSPTLEPVVTLSLLVLLVVLAYLVGNRIGRRFGVGRDRAGRLFGGLVGALNLFVLTSRLTGFLAQVGPTPPGLGGLNIRIPSFPGLNIVVPPPSESALATGWPLAAVIILLISMLVYALVRMARA